jgi:hypothetical protein
MQLFLMSATVCTAMKSQEVGRIWKRHYPHRDEQASHDICVSICSLLRELATLEVDGDYETRLARVLGSAGIPMDEFKECDAESKQQ